MSRRLTFREFSASNRVRCENPNGFNHPLSSWSASDWMTAIMGELGESANVIKKLNRVRDGVPGNKETEAELRAKLRKELGDTFVYLDLLCQSLGFHVEDAAIEVFNAKSLEIGYAGHIDVFVEKWPEEPAPETPPAPSGVEQDAALAYHLGEERYVKPPPSPSAQVHALLVDAAQRYARQEGDQPRAFLDGQMTAYRTVLKLLEER
jgi:NTP pyrophosphatase (non-canonical NTP hydrolase)